MEIEITKKHLIIILIVLTLITIKIVFSLDPGNPAFMGHNANEIGPGTINGKMEITSSISSIIGLISKNSDYGYISWYNFYSGTNPAAQIGFLEPGSDILKIKNFLGSNLITIGQNLRVDSMNIKGNLEVGKSINVNGNKILSDNSMARISTYYNCSKSATDYQQCGYGTGNCRGQLSTSPTCEDYVIVNYPNCGLRTINCVLVHSNNTIGKY